MAYASEALSEEFCEEIFARGSGGVEPLDEGLEGEPVGAFEFDGGGVWKE